MRDFEATSYVLGSDVMFTLTNRSRQVLFFWACSEGAPPRPTGKIDRHLETGWAEIDGLGGFCPGVGVAVQVPFAPGESMQMGVHLGRSSHVGTLRVRITNDDRVLGVSNSFTITN